MALITCPECGKRFSSLAKACPECAYPVTEKDIIEKIDKLVFEIPDGTVEIIGQYEQQLQHLHNECDNAAAELEQLIMQLTEDDFPEIADDWERKKRLHRREQEFQQYSQNFEYFMTESLPTHLHSLASIFLKNALQFPKEQVRQLFAEMKAEYTQISQFYSDIIDEAIYKINNMPAPQSHPVIVSASWTAVAINEFNSALDRAERQKQGVNIAFYEGRIQGAWAFYQKKSDKCGKKFIQDALSVVKASFVDQSIQLQGRAVNKPHWQQWILATSDPSKYVPIIYDNEAPIFLRPILQHFGISNSSLIDASVNTISTKITSPSQFETILQQEEPLIDKICLLTNCKKDIIIQNVARTTLPLLHSQINMFITYYQPSSVHLNTAIPSEEIVSQDISMKTLDAFADILGSELWDSLSTALNQPVCSASEVISILVKCVGAKREEIRQTSFELQKKLKVYDADILVLQNELTQCGFFNFLKRRNLQIEIEKLQSQRQAIRQQLDKLLS